MTARLRPARIGMRALSCAAAAFVLLTGCDSATDERAANEKAIRDFLRGNAAFARSESAEAESNRPDGDATARERAMADAEDALAAWRTAAATRWDWPEARRNVERAILRLEGLRQKKQGPSAKPEGPDPRPSAKPEGPDPGPSAKPEGPDPSQDPPIGVVTAELPSEQVIGLFEVLIERERQKQVLRRARRAAPSGTVERDW